MRNLVIGVLALASVFPGCGGRSDAPAAGQLSQGIGYSYGACACGQLAVYDVPSCLGNVLCITPTGGGMTAYLDLSTVAYPNGGGMGFWDGKAKSFIGADAACGGVAAALWDSTLMNAISAPANASCTNIVPAAFATAHIQM